MASQCGNEELFNSYEQGEINNRAFVREAERAAHTLNLLNQQDLDKLNSAIASAEQSMASLGDSARNGRSVVLSANGEAGWVSRLMVQNPYALSKAANKIMSLTRPDGRQFSVIFDRSNRAPSEAQQVIPFAYPEDNDRYLLTLRLLTVQST